MSRDYVDSEHVNKSMRKAWADREAILRVARAAENVHNKVNWLYYGYDVGQDELGIALKEVEHLLG